MKILTLDPNTESSGWCLYDDELEDGHQLYSGFLISKKDVLVRDKEMIHTIAISWGMSKETIELIGLGKKGKGKKSEAFRMRLQRHQLIEQLTEVYVDYGVSHLDKTLGGFIDLAIVENVFMEHNPKVPIAIRSFASFILGGLVKDMIVMQSTSWMARSVKTSPKKVSVELEMSYKTQKHKDKVRPFFNERVIEHASKFIGKDIEIIDEATAVCMMQTYLNS
jgi:hypothetical protein